MKKLTDNTFLEGMVQDTHPLMMSNNALTDCLNGTLITMNGNEFILQNDMGNGRVEKAYLPPGYVPVGIKEFGGVIYVASYNPLTNKGLIGSFPSPERNIDLEELGVADTVVTWDNFFPKGANECSTFIVKTELFGGKIMRSGDKFTIYFDPDNTNLDTLQLLSNYNNCSTLLENEDYIEYGEVESPKKNAISIYLTVLDSNNNLRDITDLLKRFKEGQTTPLKFDASVLPVIKNNAGYFIEKLSSVPSDINNAFTLERLKRAVNTYNNKLFGKIYLTVQLNIIDHIDVSVYGFKREDDGEWKIPSTMEIDTDSLGQNSNIILVFDTEYFYNCPDGFTDPDGVHENNSITGYTKYLGKYNNSYIKGILLQGSRIVTDLTSLDENLNILATLNFPIKQGNQKIGDVPEYNSEEDLYSIKQKALLPLEVRYSTNIKTGEKTILNPIFNYTITPWMTYSPLNGLAIPGSINLNKLTDGTVELSTWKYYCDNEKIRITWGFDSYPLWNTKVSNVTFHFYEVLKKGINESDFFIGSKEIEPKASYNGTFTLSLPYDDEELPITKNNIYLVLISYEIESLESGTNIDNNVHYAGARWLVTNGIFNGAYLNNTKYSTLDYNDFTTDTPVDNDEYSSTIFLEHKRYTYKENVEELFRLDLSSSWDLDVSKYLVTNSSSGELYKVGDSIPGGIKYLSKKNVTKLDSTISFKLSDSILDTFPFLLDQLKVTHTFTLNKGDLIYDSLNIDGNAESLNNLIGSDIFTPDDDSEYGDNIINNAIDGENNWLSLGLNTLDNNQFVLSINSGVHSLIAGLPVMSKLYFLNCYTLFLNATDLELYNSVFKFDPSASTPKRALGFRIHNYDHTWGDTDYWWDMYMIESNGGNSFSSGSLALESFRSKSRTHSTIKWEFEETLDEFSSLMDKTLGSPVISFLCGPNNKNIIPDYSFLLYGNSEMGSSGTEVNRFALIFWKGIDDKYYILDTFRKDSTEICNIIVEAFKDIYIYKEDCPNKSIYKINPDDGYIVYMRDFNVIINVNIDVKWEISNTDDPFIVKSTGESYLNTLINNTKTILEANKELGEEECLSSLLDVDKFDKFISGVWFTIKSSKEEHKQYSSNVLVKGTLEDYDTLISLDSVLTNQLLGADGSIKTVDSDNALLSPSKIYYYSLNDGLYSTDNVKAPSKFRNLSKYFVVKNSTLLAKDIPSSTLKIKSRRMGGDGECQILFHSVPTIKLGTSIFSGNLQSLI